ncbi:MAG TPA: flagellar biosynthesis protein FliQ [Candidatus Adamsella sp.]|nr:flagellar biosynthesis protein FliQ [Candidatus Adamsella sp.]
MEQIEFISILQQTMILVLILATPVLAVSMFVGLIISILQAVTQIQESTITFVPKIIAGIVVLIVTFPWMLQVFTDNVRQIFEKMATI